MSDTTDVTSTLAELERKLRELEHELASIGRRRLRPSEQTGAAEQNQATGRLVDEEVEYERPPAPSQPSTPAPSSQPSTPPAPSGPSTPAPPAGASRPSRSMASPQPLAPTRGTAPVETFGSAERAIPTDAQLAGLADLRRFRDRLERFAKELTEDYDALLGRVMSSLSARGPESDSDAFAAGLATADTHAPAEPPPPPPPPHEETLFEGRVELGVGPFYDIASLGAFEQRLAELPYVLEVSVRRFEASHAVIDLRLAAPVALVSELRRVLETDFGVRQVAGGRLLLTFDDA
jgi:hypothetical protein